MKFTNKHALPDVFVRAVINDPYNNGGSDFTSTSLAAPARASAIIRQHTDLEVDVSSRVAAIIGNGSHSTAERAARPGIDLCEDRFFADFIVDGTTYKVSAQVDLYETDTQVLYDWKTTKAYTFSKKAGSGKKPEWVSQLNVAAEIMRRNGHNPKALKIIAMLKDWEKREAGQAGMPISEVVEVELPMWSREKTVAWIEERIRAHVSARHTLPQCTSLEAWGGRRCADYCDAAGKCDQYKKALTTGTLETKATEQKPEPTANVVALFPRAMAKPIIEYHNTRIKIRDSKELFTVRRQR